MKKIILVILVIIALGILGNYYYKKQTDKSFQKPNIVSQQQSQPEQKTEPLRENKSSVKTYTLVEVAKHGSDMDNYVDCWTVINGNVYDITEYADSLKHPGGEQIYQACGTDATALFEDRPGKGTPHPESAREILEKYYIGDLQK
jgi:cytochrome b involved in lipid metabolism